MKKQVPPLEIIYRSTIEDPLHNDNENRLVLIGKTINYKTLAVIHLEKTDSIRIISARKATKQEYKFYEEY